MSTTNGDRSRARAGLVLPTVFAEQLADRRVLFIGDAATADVERLAAGCRALRVLDTGRGEGGGRRRGRAFRSSPYRPGPLGFQPGSFDAVVVPEAAALGDETRERLADLARIVDGGPILVATDPEVGVGYDALYGWLADLFENVRIFGESPFVGVAVGDFEAPRDPEVVVDASLVAEESAPRAFLAVASDSPLRIASYTILRLPEPDDVEPAPAREGARRDESDRRRVDALEDEIARLEETAAERLAALERARESARDLERRLAAAERAATRAPAADPEVVREIADLEQRLVDRAKRIRELEAEVERRGQLVRDAVEELRALRKTGSGDPGAVERAVAAEVARAESQFEVDELRARLRELEDALAKLERHASESEGRARGFLSRLHEILEVHENTAARLGVAEAEILARDEEVRSVHRELEETKDQLELALLRASGGPTSSGDVAAPSSSAATERLEGRVVGLRFRLANAERALAAKSIEAKRGEGALDTVDALRAEIAAQKAENGALTIEVVDLRAEVRELRGRAGDSASALAARDALVTRLQHELSQVEQDLRNAELRSGRLAEEAASLRAAVVDAATAAEARERTSGEAETLRAQLAELRDRARNLEADRVELEERAGRAEALVRALEERLTTAERGEQEQEQKAKRLESERAALADEVLALATELATLDEQRRAAEAAAPEGRSAADERADLMEAEVELLRAHAEAIAKERDDARALLAETREMLESLRAGEAGGAAAPELAGDVGSELRDRDVLLRSHTAPLEARNDRIRALERRLSGSIPAGPPDDELLKRELLELQERAIRLGDEVAAEREARRAAETRLEALERAPDVAAEIERLRDEASRAQKDLDLERGRAEGFERDVRSLRDVCGEARQGLEALLGSATASGDQLAADRIGQLLTVLGRY